MAERGPGESSVGESALVRLAVWSGPRNISTAMMRSWENRSDTVVVDEPFYAHYLAVSGVDHPGRELVLASGETDWRTVVAGLLAPAPAGVRVAYSKQMVHHLTPEMDRGWIGQLTNVLLIRDPREVVASYLRSRPHVDAADVGVGQLGVLYDELSDIGAAPPVIDTADFLRDPEAYSRALCDLVGVPYEAGMVEWPAGPRASDGVWGPHWYSAVWRSTGFEPYRPREVELSGAGAAVAEAARPTYERLHAVRWLVS